MCVSVLINTRNRPEFLSFVLGKLAPQFRGDDELILVDDGSVPPLTRELLTAWLGKGVPVRLVHNDESHGLIRARNQGLREAQGEFVLQLDDDSWPVGDHVFERLEAGMAQYPRAGALAFPVHEHCSGRQDEVGSLYPRCRLPDAMRDFAFIGCGVALRRQVVLDVGGYPEYGTYGSEEEALGLRLWRRGYEIRVCHAVRVIHGHERLSAGAGYRATRQNDVLTELASNRLCCYRECLPGPYFLAMRVLETIRVCARGGVAVLRSVHRAAAHKRPLLADGMRLTWWQAAHWARVRLGVLQALQRRRESAV